MKEKELNRLRRRAWLARSKWRLEVTYELGGSTRPIETPWQMLNDFELLPGQQNELHTVSPFLKWLFDQLESR